MKNLLVLLITVGIGSAYWYQLPDPASAPAPAPVPPAAKVEPPVRRAPFVPTRTMLDDPAVRVGSQPRPSSVLIGTDNLK